MFDYWDIDEILSESAVVTCKAKTDIAGGGILATTGRQRDAQKDQTLQVPLWLAQKFVRRNIAELNLPQKYGTTAVENLTEDPTVYRASEKGENFFEVGIKIGYLIGDMPLVNKLLESFDARWQEIISILGRFGTPSTFHSQLKMNAIFPDTLTAVEQKLQLAGKESEQRFQRFLGWFGFHTIEASELADVATPAKRQRTR